MTVNFELIETLVLLNTYKSQNALDLHSMDFISNISFPNEPLIS